MQAGAFVWIDSSRVTGNRAPAGGGACVVAGGGLFVINGSSVSGNTATDSGGGIYGSGALDVQDSEVSGNSATNNGGGITALDGVTVARSTLAGNTAGAPSSTTVLGGAILTNGYTLIRESTLSGNTSGDGAAIGVTGSSYLEIRGATIANNIARASTGGAARMESSATSDFVVGTMFSNNQPRSCSSSSGAQQISSNGYNHDTGGSCAFFGVNDRKNVAANLGPLALNGGPTRTHALLPGSSGIDAGTNSCAAKDQRGISVPTGIGTTRALDGDGDGTATCDVGSYEVKRDLVAPTVSGVDLLDPSPTAEATIRWRVRFSEPVFGVDAADLGLTTTGVSGAGISTVAGESTAPTSNWIVTAASGSGTNGTVRLDVLSSATIRDASNMALVAGATGSAYTISRSTGGGAGGGGGAIQRYAPLVPARVADTRSPNATIDGVSSGGGPLGAGAVLVVPIAGRGGVPVGSTAVSLNVTIVDPRSEGYATIWPCDQAQPNASNLNFQSGQTIPNAVVTKLAADGSVCIYTYASAHVLIDVNGSFAVGSEFQPLVPARVADTRGPNATIDGASSGGGAIPGGGVLVVPVAGRGGVPAGAPAVSLNVTSVNPRGGGYATVWPCDQPQPNASNLNFDSGRTIPNAVLTKLAANGTVCIFTYTTTDILVDVNGWFSGTTTLLSLVPARLADTRSPNATVDGLSSGGGAMGAGSTLVIPVSGRGGVPAGASAVSLNVTAVSPANAGYVTVWPCDQPQPNASNLNFGPGQTIPNAVLSKLAANGTVCVFTTQTMHLLIDVNGAL